MGLRARQCATISVAAAFTNNYCPEEHGADVTGTIGGAWGTAADVAFGTREFRGTVSGRHIDMRLTGRAGGAVVAPSRTSDGKAPLHRDRSTELRTGRRDQRMRWQRRQKCEPRFMNCSRTIGRPQRGHGLPCCP